jgi:hypothetical protein
VGRTGRFFPRGRVHGTRRLQKALSTSATDIIAHSQSLTGD